MLDLDVKLLLKVICQTSHNNHYYGCEIVDQPHMHRGIDCDERHDCSCGWPKDRENAINMLKDLSCE